MSVTKKAAGWRVFAIVSIVILGCVLLACVGTYVGLALHNRIRNPSLLATEPTQASSDGPQPPRSTPTSSPTAIARPTRTPTRQATPLPTRTPTAAPTRQATAVATATRADRPSATPTPIVCDDVGALSSLTIAPGQPFTCTIDDQALNEQIAEYPDLPCSELEVRFTDGEVRMVCKMGIRMTAAGVVEVDDCQASIRIVRGTVGFAQAVQTLLDEYTQLAPYDVVCIEEATLGEGTITISGRGR